MGDLFRRRDDWSPCLPAFARILHGRSRFLFLLVGHLQGDRRVTVCESIMPFCDDEDATRCQRTPPLLPVQETKVLVRAECR